MDLLFKLYSLLKNLFVKQEKPQILLSFNMKDLSTKMQQYSTELYHFKSEDSWKLLKRVIETARNIQILEVNRYKPNASTAENLAHSRGRLEALNDLVSYIELAFDDAHQKSLREEKPKTKVLRKTIKNHGHQAVIQGELNGRSGIWW